jgi:hypothetical protein
MSLKTTLLTIGLATALLATSAAGSFAHPIYLLPIGHGPVIHNGSGSGVYRGPVYSIGQGSGISHGPIYPVGPGPIWPPYGDYGNGGDYGYGNGDGGDWWWDHHHHHHHHHGYYPL